MERALQPDSDSHSTNDSNSQFTTNVGQSTIDDGKPRSKGIGVVVWIVILLAFAGVFYLVLHHHDDAVATAPTARRGGGVATVTTATVRKGEIGVYVDAIGTVTPVYTASITSQVSGIVTAVHFTEGQMVQKGTPLIEIDSRSFAATLAQAQGILERDKATLSQAQMDLARYQAAWARNAIPKQTLDDQEKLVAQDQGTVHNDEGTVQYDEIQVGYCHIVAPISGRVGLRLVDPGNVVAANGATALAVVTQIQPITVVFSVAEDDLSKIEPQLRKRAKLEVDALDRGGLKQIAKGTLLTLDNQIDTTTGMVKARAQFANKDSSLFPNQFVNTRLLVKKLEDVTLIPTAAIQHNGQAAFAFVLDDNKAHLRPITVGVTNGDTAQVEGIEPGEVLATSNFDKLQEGATIAVSTRPENAGRSSSH